MSLYAFLPSRSRTTGGDRRGRRLLVVAAALAVGACAAAPSAPRPPTELRVVLRADPRTFNPTAALDAASTTLIAMMHAELFRVDARSQEVVPELAERLDGPDREGAVVVTLRRGLRFSDGAPFTADDVVFSLRVFQDPALGAPQLSALRLAGQPAQATALDDHTVRIQFGARHAEPARLLTSVSMLPRHRLERVYAEGRLGAAWALGERPDAIVGLGPYRLERYEPGVSVTLVRNPPSAPADRSRPGIDRLIARVISDPDAQVARMLAGDVDLLSALDTRSYRLLAGARRPDLEVRDLGPALEFTFVVLNLDDPPRAVRPPPRTRWFRDAAFRQALSQAVDREAIARLVYDGLATPLGGHVSPGNRRWRAPVPVPTASIDGARTRLSAAGYRWDSRGRLIDAAGQRVVFSLLTSTSNPQRERIASVVHDDLAALGIEVRVTSLEFRAYVERLTRTRDFDAAIMALGGGDVDPNAEAGVWQLDGATHVWRLKAPLPLAPWEAELDRVFRDQAVAVDLDIRRQLFTRLQIIVAEQLPIIPLVSPNHLVALRRGLDGLAPGVTSRDSLWNVDELSWAASVAR